MSAPTEPAILDLSVLSLQTAVRRIATRLLEGDGPLDLGTFRRVERLMWIAVAVGGGGTSQPFVEVHGIPAEASDDVLPGILSVSLTDLLAARASDHLPDALMGAPAALHALEAEAETMLTTEDVQLT